MKKKILALGTILIAIVAVVSAATMISGQASVVGKVYTMDNAAANNVWQCDRMADGSLAISGVFSTGGNGTDSKLASQGAVTLSDDGMWFFE